MLEVGQELYLVQNHYHASQKHGMTVTVEKVGRKWATLDKYNTRIHKDELWVDGGAYTSPGQCYLSEADFLDHKNACKEYLDLQNAVRNSSQKTFTREQISAARTALGLDT